MPRGSGTQMNIQQRREYLYSGQDQMPGTVKDFAAKTYFSQSFEPTSTEEKAHYEERVRENLTRLGLSETEVDLYLRRYTVAQVQISTARMSVFKQEVSTITEELRISEDMQMRGMSRKEKKAFKERRDKESKEAFAQAKENVTTEFADEAAVLTTWGKKEVLDKKVKAPSDDGSTDEITQEQLLSRVLVNGDCSNLEQLDPVLRNLAAKKYMEGFQFNGNITSPEDFVNGLFKQGGVAALMHPLFRIGISILAKGGTVTAGVFQNLPQEYFREIEDLCNQRIMSSTMYTIPDAGAEVTTEQAQQNKDAQIFMMKTLFMAHLGGMTKYTDKQAGAWDQSMASAFSHCSRVAYTLPKAADGGGRDIGLQGFKKRTAATHRLRRKRADGSNDLIEKKVRLGWYWGQHGMNVGVGGLGNKGIPGKFGQERRIKNDGSGGHIYVHQDIGDQSSYTGLLIGFESDAPGVLNQTGHKHGTGNPEFMSSFGGLRTDEVGDKYGGRAVDCSGLDPAAFDIVMASFLHRIDQLQMAVNMNPGRNPGMIKAQRKAQDELINICDLLSGKQMTKEQIISVAGINEQQYNALHRQG